MLKKKCQHSYEKLFCQVYQVRNEDFACKKSNQTLWKDRWKFEFTLDSIQIIINIVTLGWRPNIHMELLNISSNFPFIQVGKWWCEMQLFHICPYQSMWWPEFCSDWK